MDHFTTMVDDPLVQWIKTELQKGKAASDLKKILLKQRYTAAQVENAFTQVNQKPKENSWFVRLIIALGLGLISLVLILIALGVLFIAVVPVLGYIMIAATAILMSFLIYKIQQHTDSLNQTGITMIITAFDSLRYLKQVITTFNTEDSYEQVSRLMGIFGVEGFIPSSFLVAIPFYLLANIFTIRTIIASKDYKLMQSYLLLFLLYGIAFGIGQFIIHTFLIVSL